MSEKLKGIEVVILRDIIMIGNLSESYFVKIYGYSPRQIIRVINNLIKKGYLKKIKNGWFIEKYEPTEKAKWEITRICQKF